MAYDPEIHHRRSTRLKGFDYSSANAYFVTICTEGREATLADVEDGEVLVREAGVVVHDEWGRLPQRFPGLGLDVFIVMPTHIHGILVLGYDPEALASSYGNDGTLPTLGQVMRAFKSRSAVAANRALGREGGAFWQCGFYDRVVRNDRELSNIRIYIQVNPANWLKDENNPDFLDRRPSRPDRP